MFLSRRKDEDSSSYVARILGHFQRNRNALQQDRDREIRNWRAYSGVNDGQWDAEAIALLREEGRPAHTINIIQGAVDLAAGIVTQNPHATVFDPIDPSVDNQVNIAQWLFDFERDRGNWKREEMSFIIAGLVFRAVAQFYPDYQHSKLGNVGWKVITPWEVEPDARWSTDDIMDCRVVFKSRLCTADEIASRYPTKNEAVREAVTRAQEGNASINLDRVLDNGGTITDYATGDQYRVIECYFQEETRESKLYDSERNIEVTGQPDSILDLAVQEDSVRYKKMVTVTSVTKVVTICPGLDSNLILAEGSYPFQLGRLPFQFWSAKNLWGERQGLVDVMYDLQTLLNKRESSITHWESLNANNSIIANSDAFPDQKDRDNLERNLNKPAQVFWADGGPQGIKDAIIPVSSGNPPVHLVDGAARVMQYLAQVGQLATPFNPAQGQTGANSKHYSEILSAGFVKFEVLNQGLGAAWAERAAGFIPCAKYIYSGPPRRLKSPNSRQSLVLNQKVPDESGLNWSVVNSIETLERYDYTIEVAKDGANQKQLSLNDIRAQLQLVSNPILKTRMEMKLIELGDYSEDEKSQMLKDSEMFAQFQAWQFSQQMKAAEQAQAAQDQQMQMNQMGMGGGGQPPPSDAKTAASGPGMGEIPGEAGIAGSATAANNVQSKSPSDMNR